MIKKDLYAEDGVNVEAGDAFSAIAGRVCRDSFKNSPHVKVYDLSDGYFRGVRGFRFHHLPRGYMFDMTSDGDGSKVILNAMAGNYEFAAYDLLAMCGMDVTRNGGMGLVFNNVLDVSSLGEDGSSIRAAFIRLITGLSRAAKSVGAVCFRGETAELGVCVGSENPDSGVKFNWSASMLGVYHKSKMITGNTIAPGMKIIALKENGFRANGISSVRKALANKFGARWWEDEMAMPYIRAAATPSVLYDPFLQAINGWSTPSFEQQIKVHGLIHLSGGAFEGKLGHDILFPRGLSAVLDNLWDPPKIMKQCAEWRGMGDYDIYKTWNGGQGALAIVSPEDVEGFLYIADEGYGIEAQVCGKITKTAGFKPQIQIASQFDKDVMVVYMAP